MLSFLRWGYVMNIYINYDFIEAVQGSNDPLNPIKVMKYTLKHNYFWKIYMVGSLTINSIRESFGKALGSTLLGAGGSFMIATVYFLIKKKDPLKEISDIKLNNLSCSLQKIGVNTDQELIKESRLEGRKYEFKFNKKIIPQMIESKYILVPTYNNIGEVKETSILQEHTLFTNEYVLSKSRGLEKNKKVLAYSNI